MVRLGGVESLPARIMTRSSIASESFPVKVFC
jgi:hypothetical protein